VWGGRVRTHAPGPGGVGSRTGAPLQFCSSNSSNSSNSGGGGGI